MSNELAQALNPELFWDVEMSEVDDDVHRRFIIQRVLKRGTLADWRLTCDHYTLPVVGAEAQQMRPLDPKALAFITLLGDVKKETFRCYSPKPLHPQH